ncbi:MAG: hypothetical protein P1V35_14960, partial [Planctomycetota bacterium]|nr:hypothetical protein [Planctomycetota bacterium]
NTLWLFRQVDFEGRPAGVTQESLPAELVEQGREYLSLRGLRGDGGPAQDNGIRLGRAEWTRTPANMRTRGGREATALDPGDRSGGPARIGVEFKFQGALVPRLGEGLCLWLEGGTTLVQALETVSQLFPRTGHWLISDGKPVPAVLRGGQVLQGSSPWTRGMCSNWYSPFPAGDSHREPGPTCCRFGGPYAL